MTGLHRTILGVIRQLLIAFVLPGAMSAAVSAQDKPDEKSGDSPQNISADDAADDKSTTKPGTGIDAVLDHIEQSSRETADRIAQVIQNMRDVQSRVSNTDTGRETQQIQKQIVSDLDALIQAARKQQQQQQQQQQSQQQQQNSQQQRQQNQNSQQQPPDKQQQPSGANQPTPDGRRQDGQESANQTSQAQAAASEAAQRQVILQQVWGHLPERLRERVLNMKDDRYLPKYEGLIRQYFEALAEKRDGRNDR